MTSFYKLSIFKSIAFVISMLYVNNCFILQLSIKIIACAHQENTCLSCNIIFIHSSLQLIKFYTQISKVRSDNIIFPKPESVSLVVQVLFL